MPASEKSITLSLQAQCPPGTLNAPHDALGPWTDLQKTKKVDAFSHAFAISLPRQAPAGGCTLGESRIARCGDAHGPGYGATALEGDKRVQVYVLPNGPNEPAL